MSVLKIIGIVLIAAGIAALVYGQITYTKETHEVDLGPIDLAVKEKRTVNVPLWVGIGAVVAGVLFLVAPRRK